MHCYHIYLQDTKSLYMKSRNIIIVSVAAGLAVAGLVSYLFFTEDGRENLKKWQKKGKDLAGKAEDYIGEAKNKYLARKENIPASERIMPEPYIQEMFE